MESKQIIEIGNKHFEEKQTEKKDQKVWIDAAHVMAFITDRSDIQNIFNNYKAMDQSKTEDLIKQVEDKQTAKAKFGIDYMKDVLKLLTKFDKSITQVTIGLGNDKPISLEVTDDRGRCMIILAPRMDY